MLTNFNCQTCNGGYRYDGHGYGYGTGYRKVYPYLYPGYPYPRTSRVYLYPCPTLISPAHLIYMFDLDTTSSVVFP
jgi:hypothetical protein